jgi:hypothetical protein
MSEVGSNAACAAGDSGLGNAICDSGGFEVMVFEGCVDVGWQMGLAVGTAAFDDAELEALEGVLGFPCLEALASRRDKDWSGRNSFFNLSRIVIGGVCSKARIKAE